MNAQKTLRPPENWQDFESLCKKLWGEIWQCPEIQKNGRLGQDQSGVDVFGTPYNDPDNYYGIQCKGKNEYSKSKFTEDEILEEIAKAMDFKPPLKKYYLVTTAQNDSKIQEFVRVKNIEHKSKGLFEVHLFAWESIVDLIETNRETFDYYVSNKQFKTKYELEITFGNGQKEFVIHPKFKKKISKYKLSKPSQLTNRFPNIKHDGFNPKLSWMMAEHKNVNCSWSSFTINFKNTGSEVLEDYKIFIYPEVHKLRELGGYLGNILNELEYLKHSPVYVFTEEKYARYIPNENSPLIQKDSKSFDLHILANHDEYELKLKVELLARNFSMDSELTLIVKPIFELSEETIWVDDELLLQDDSITFEDNMESGGLF